MNVIVLLEKDLNAGWTWLQNEARDLWTGVRPILEGALHDLEQGVVVQLWSAAAALAQKAAALFSGSMSLADLETAFMNAAQGLVPGLVNLAERVGSQVIQSILGLFQAKAAQPATA